MATLFAIVTVALVAGFGLLPDTADVAAIDASGADEGARAGIDDPGDESADGLDADRQSRPTTTVTSEPPPVRVSQTMRYELALSALAIHDAVNDDVADERAEPPSAPTTAAPTTAPTTEAPTTTTVAPPPSSETTAAAVADPETTTSIAEGTESSETTDTTAPGDAPAPETSETTEASPTTTAHPDGYVDAGHGVFVPPILLDIRFCESTDNYTAANPSSSARGAYQFLTGSWEAYGHADRYGVAQAHLATPAQQDEAALITWQRDGTRPWNASRHCWG